MAAHVLAVLRRAGDPRRAPPIAEPSALNQLCLEELRQRDPQRLADLLAGELTDADPMLRALPVLWRLRVGRWVTFKLHLGVEADLPTAFSYDRTDLLVHGYDIATAAEPLDGRPHVGIRRGPRKPEGLGRVHPPRRAKRSGAAGRRDL